MAWTLWCCPCSLWRSFDRKVTGSSHGFRRPTSDVWVKDLHLSFFVCFLSDDALLFWLYVVLCVNAFNLCSVFMLCLRSVLNQCQGVTSAAGLVCIICLIDSVRRFRLKPPPPTPRLKKKKKGRKKENKQSNNLKNQTNKWVFVGWFRRGRGAERAFAKDCKSHLSAFTSHNSTPL